MTVFKKILLFPLTRIIIGFLTVALVVTGIQIGVSSALESFNFQKDTTNFISNVSGMLAGFFSYKLLFHFYEQRKITELSAKNSLRDSGTGLLLGVGLQSLVILTIFLMGYYTIVQVNHFSSLLMPLGIAITSGVVEEILFRGIIFRITEEKLGSVIALVISSMIFGLIHLANKNATFFSAVSIALQAGFLLGCSYILTRKLWFPIFLHIGWNFAEGGIFGAAISGMDTTSLITSKIQGPGIFSGGDFGPENSVFATSYCLVAAIVILYLAIRKGNIIRPIWKKSHPPSALLVVTEE